MVHLLDPQIGDLRIESQVGRIDMKFFYESRCISADLRILRGTNKKIILDIT